MTTQTPAQAAHTPGPWRFTPPPIGTTQPIVFSTGNPMPICSMNACHTVAEEQANARLIAAAPELLVALEAIHAALNQPVQFTDSQTASDILRMDATFARNLARAAIAKATLQP